MPLTQPQTLVFIHPWLRDLRDRLDGFAPVDEREAESGVGPGSSQEAECDSDAGSADGTDHDASAPASPLHAEPSPRVDTSTQALRLLSRLGCRFNALLLEQQNGWQYRRVAAEHEIIVRGIPSKTNPKDIQVKVLEII